MEYKAVRGKNFRSSEMANWREANYLTFLRFCEQFMVPSETGPKYSNTTSLWIEAEGILDMPDHPFQEYLWRINFFSTTKGSSYRKFFAKLRLLMNTVLMFIKKNPSVVTDQMRKVLEIYPAFQWSLQQTEIVTTSLGIDIVKQNPGVATFEQRLYTTGVKVVDMLERLVDSISEKDFKEMKARDKMIAVGRMGYIFQIAKNLKPNKAIFNQINIHGADRETLEKTLLEMNRKS